jgi:hypothetical protein
MELIVFGMDNLIMQTWITGIKGCKRSIRRRRTLDNNI